MKKIFSIILVFLSIHAFSQNDSNYINLYNRKLASPIYHRLTVNESATYPVDIKTPLKGGVMLTDSSTGYEYISSLTSDAQSQLNSKLAITDTSGHWVTKVCRKSGTDSVFYWIGATKTFAFIDSTGGGSGWAVTGTTTITGDVDVQTNGHNVTIGENDASLYIQPAGKYVRTRGYDNTGAGNTGATEAYADATSATGKISADFNDGTKTSSVVATANTSESVVELNADRVYASGNVGIGTTTPAYKLDVLGNQSRLYDGFGESIAMNVTGDGFADILGNNTLYSWRLGFTDDFDASLFGIGSSSDIAFYTKGVERMRVDTLGNVGIGTSTPTSKAHINGSISLPIVTKTANYTVTVNDYTIIADANTTGVTITLPLAADVPGRIYVIKAVDISNDVKVTHDGSDKIDGSSGDYLFSSANESIMIQSDGTTNWYILSKN